MNSSKPFCVDFDDLCDATRHTLPLIQELSDKYPRFRCTLYTIPQRTSAETIDEAKGIKGVQLAPHGWRHTKGECLSWTDEETEAKIVIAAERGIDAPVFKAPGWLIDGPVYSACEKLNYVIASHDTFRIPNTGVLEYIYNRYNRYYKPVHGHLSKVEHGAASKNYIKDMKEQGHLDFKEGTEFTHPQAVASVIT